MENKWKEKKRKEKGYASTHRKVALHILIISCSRGYETRTVFFTQHGSWADPP